MIKTRDVVTMTVTHHSRNTTVLEELPEGLPDCTRMRWLILQHDANRTYFADRKATHR